jgi:putative SOS response-associated peptidase YedK
MCNDYRSRVELDTIRQDFSDIKIRIRFPEGLPNLQARDDIRITDTGPIVRAAPDESGAADLVQRRWSWPGPGGRPVYNFRSENREFTNGRCLIIADGFYEFTAHSDPKSRRKHKWLFTKSDEPCSASPAFGARASSAKRSRCLRSSPARMSRRITIGRSSSSAGMIGRAGWTRNAAAKGLLRPLPAGSLRVELVQ